MPLEPLPKVTDEDEEDLSLVPEAIPEAPEVLADTQNALVTNDNPDLTIDRQSRMDALFRREAPSTQVTQGAPEPVIQELQGITPEAILDPVGAIEPERLAPTREQRMQKLFRTTPVDLFALEEEDATRRVESEYSATGDVVHVLRKALQGVSNVPDMGLHIMSMMGSVEVEENPDFPSVPSDSPVIQSILDFNPSRDILGPMVNALAEWSQVALKEGYSVKGLTDLLIPQTSPSSNYGKWAGVAAEGAAESMTVALKMATQAKKLKNLDSVPKFLKPIYEGLKKDPKLIFKQEFYSGAMAALSGTAAQQWYLENFDNPELAPFVTLIAAAAGGSIKDPLVAPKLVTKTTKSTGLVLAKGTRAGASKLREFIGRSADHSEAADEFFNKHTYGKILNSGINFVAGKETDDLAKTLLQEAADDPVLRQLVTEITETVNITDKFSDQLVVARKTADTIDGMILTTANVSEDAKARGLSKDFGDIDPKASLKAHKENVKAVKKFYEKTFEEGTPQDIAEIQRAAQQNYNQTVIDTHDTVRAVERSLEDIRLADNSVDPSALGKEARARVSDLKDMYKQLNDQLFDIDPLNQIKLPTSTFDNLLRSDEFSNFDPTNLGGARVRQAMGAALASTLTKRMKTREISSARLGEDASALISRVSKGDVTAIREVPSNLRVLHYQDADQLVKDLWQAKEDLFDNTTVGGGSASRAMGSLARRSEDDFTIGLKDSGNVPAAAQRKAAKDFYGLYLGGYFDPSGTATAKLLKNKSFQEPAVSNADALESIFSKRDEMVKFMDLTDPAKVGKVLLDPESSQFGKWLKNDVNMDVSSMAPDTMATLRKTMESHVIESSNRAIRAGRDKPREALARWMNVNADSLDLLPELKSKLNKRRESPTLGNPELDTAMRNRVLAEQAVTKNQLNGIFGPGAFGRNARSILEDPQATSQVSTLLDVVDTTGKLRSTFVNGAIRDALIPDSNGVINPEQVHKFMEKHGKGLKNIATKETLEALDNLQEATKIVRRGDVPIGGINRDIEGTQSWVVREVPKIWTSLRQRETFGANRTRLGLIHAGSFVTGRALKMDSKTQETMGEVYAAILSDPDVAEEFIEASLKWNKVSRATDRAAADARLAQLFAGLGAPITAIPVAVEKASEVVTALSQSEEEVKEVEKASKEASIPNVISEGSPDTLGTSGTSDVSSLPGENTHNTHNTHNPDNPDALIPTVGGGKITLEPNGNAREDAFTPVIGDGRITLEPNGDTEEPEVLTDTGKKTSEGRPIFKNQDGQSVTERTITEEIPELGGIFNIPTVFEGVFLPADEAIQKVIEAKGKDPITGRKLRVFNDIDTAVKAAEKRSKDLGVSLSKDNL